MIEPSVRKWQNRQDLTDCCRIIEAAASARFDQAISDCRSAVEACDDDEIRSRLFANMSLLYHQKEDWKMAMAMAERVRGSETPSKLCLYSAQLQCL